MKKKVALTAGAVLFAALSAPVFAAEQGRDWTKIDTNKDGYVSPEEMEKWLKENPSPGATKK
jgi:hypothetical protein